MRYDAIVVGLGALGAATLAELARRGASVLGLEAQPSIGHDRGSSHGHSRVIRKAYFEHPSYVPLLLRSYELWQELEAEIGDTLLVSTGCLNMGPADGELIAGVITSVETHGLAHETLDASAIRARFPALRPGPRDVGVYEQDGALLRPEACVRALVEIARKRGATTRTGVKVEKVRDGVVIVAGEAVEADAIVIATGAWLGSLVPDLRKGLRVMRQVQLWFEPDDPTPFEVGRLPCFVHVDADRVFYGLPRHGGRGVKLCQHYGGAVVEPDAVERSVTDADVAPVRSWIRRHVPAADAAPVASAVCMYTLTADHHFVVGPHPSLRGAFVAGGGSGHAFKLAPAIGEALAERIVDGRAERSIALFDPRRL